MNKEIFDYTKNVHTGRKGEMLKRVFSLTLSFLMLFEILFSGMGTSPVLAASDAEPDIIKKTNKRVGNRYFYNMKIGISDTYDFKKETKKTCPNKYIRRINNEWGYNKQIDKQLIPYIIKFSTKLTPRFY